MEISNGTIIRTVILALALINQILSVMGYSPIPIEDEVVSEFLSLAFTISASLVAWWKNNSFTKNAIESDRYLETLRRDKYEG